MRKAPWHPSPLAREGGPRSGSDEAYPADGAEIPKRIRRKATVAQARALRRTAPPIERKLWSILRDRRLEGLKFRRQVPIGRYVVDFLCLRHRLIVEADGPLHDPAHDAERDAYLRSQGFRVLRFPNHQINSRDWEVVARIVAATAPNRRD